MGYIVLYILVSGMLLYELFQAINKRNFITNHSPSCYTYIPFDSIMLLAWSNFHNTKKLEGFASPAWVDVTGLQHLRVSVLPITSFIDNEKPSITQIVIKFQRIYNYRWFCFTIFFYGCHFYEFSGSVFARDFWQFFHNDQHECIWLLKIVTSINISWSYHHSCKRIGSSQLNMYIHLLK